MSYITPYIQFQIVRADENITIGLIADWYLREWNIARDTTIQKIKNFSADSIQFQVLMTVDNVPVATGGIYDHVALLDRDPSFTIYKKWLALVYTKPESRNNGYGALLCNFIQEHAKSLGLKEIFLFTHTAESLYKRLGWQQIQRVAMNGKDVVVMKKEL